MDVCFLYLPYADVKVPALSLSMFKSALKEKGISSEIEYANISHYSNRGKFRYELAFLCRHQFFIGEMIFSVAAFGENEEAFGKLADYIMSFGKEVYQPYSFCSDNPREAILSFLREEARIASAFLDELSEYILSKNPKIVAMCSSFQQNNAVIACAKRLKAKNKDIVIMVGGCNAFENAGEALIEYIPEIDYVFLGEADELFPSVVEKKLKGEDCSSFEGVVSKEKNNTSVKYTVYKNLDTLPFPDYSDYIKAVKETKIENVQLLIEGSRGCWWGEKNSCTFCGLNGSNAIRYRQKNSNRLVEEINYLYKEFGIKEFFLTDCILSREHTLSLPQFEEKLPKDVTFFCEVKANLSYEEEKALKKIGVTSLQPGIESLSDHVLGIMKKGNRAIKMIELLKNSRRLGVEIKWNWLCGFPGETKEDYEMALAMLPKLSHLEPPKSFFGIFYHKNSFYERNAKALGLEIKPLSVYEWIYPLGNDFLERTAYVFEPQEEKERLVYHDCTRHDEKVYKEMFEFINKWIISWQINKDRLDMQDFGDRIEIFDLRKEAKRMSYCLKGTEALVYRMAEFVVSDKLLKEKLSAISLEDLEQAKKWLIEENLLLEINGEYLALAVEG